MVKLNFGGSGRKMWLQGEEFPPAKHTTSFENETIAVIGYGVQGPGQALNQKDTMGSTSSLASGKFQNLG